MVSPVSAHRIVVIVGPTASGKSDLALDLAARRKGEVVSCDSIQVYRGLDIGSGKASAADRALIPHHLLDILEVHEEMDAARFARLASEAIAEISARGHLPILSGGTGLYLTALLKGLFEQGPRDSALRTRLEGMGRRYGARRLHRLLERRDPAYAKGTKPSDLVRLVRALEVCFGQGRPFSSAQRERRPAYKGEALMIGLVVSREELRRRVTARVARMLADGLVEETRRIVSALPAGAPLPRSLGAIGYREVRARLAEGDLKPGGDEELQRAIVNSTMQYAKRQMTYFRRQFDVEWFAEKTAAVNRVEDWLSGTAAPLGPASPAGSN